VKVLNDSGTGTLSDTLEGIQWVIYHAKEYNIRVMNLSLAMDSTDSWQDDPLCVAARSAVSVGITVVVAAGNFGKNGAGQRRSTARSLAGQRPQRDHRGLGQLQGRDDAQPTTPSTSSARAARRAAAASAQPACARRTTCSSPTWWRPATRCWAPRPRAPTP
jgi:serine protease AprX